MKFINLSCFTKSKFQPLNFKNFKTFTSKTSSNIKDKSQKNTKTASSTLNSNSNIKSKSAFDSYTIYSNTTTQKYYKLNIPFIIGYLIFGASTLSNKEYPDYLRGTAKFFSSICVFALIGVSIFSKRHIHSITMLGNNMLIIKTFKYLGFGTERVFQMPVKELKEIVPLSNIIKTKSTGLYILKPFENKKYFKFLNFFFIRPTKDTLVDEKLFVSKLKR